MYLQITYLIIAYIQDINNTDLKLQPPKTSIVKKPNKKGGACEQTFQQR